MTSSTKNILIAIAAGLAAAGAAYGGGRWQGHVEADAVRAELEETRSQLGAQLEDTKKRLNTKLEETRSNLSECNTRAERLEARRRLHLAIEELTALNFGYAQQHLKKAGEQLAASAGQDEKLRTLADEIQKTDLEPTADLDEVKNRLKDFAERFDELVPPR